MHTSREPWGDGTVKYSRFQPLTSRRHVLFAAAALLCIPLLVIPSPAHAGFFGDVIKFFAGSGADTEADASSQAGGSSLSTPLLGSAGAAAASGGQNNQESIDTADGTVLPTTQDNTLIGGRNPLGTLPAEEQGTITIYTVKPGDTAGEIAAKFGISLNTLLWANNIKSAKQLKEGDSLIILPVSGVKYEVKKGDTIEKIAKKFKGDVTEILSFNGLAIGEDLQPGDTIIIPDGELEAPPPIKPKSKKETIPARFAGLPELKGYFIRPIDGGRRSRGIHGYNGVDLADSCGEPIHASAGGTVILARESGWNGGYGKYVVIAHPNGVQTLYAHMTEVETALGARVAQGDEIGLIGSTGNSTGCHVHFEVRGARNPF